MADESKVFAACISVFIPRNDKWMGKSTCKSIFHGCHNYEMVRLGDAHDGGNTIKVQGAGISDSRDGYPLE